MHLGMDFLAWIPPTLISCLWSTDDILQLQEQSCDTSSIGRRIPQPSSLDYLVIIGQLIEKRY
jgi:hypothetical protein